MLRALQKLGTWVTDSSGAAIPLCFVEKGQGDSMMFHRSKPLLNPKA